MRGREEDVAGCRNFASFRVRSAASATRVPGVACHVRWLQTVFTGMLTCEVMVFIGTLGNLGGERCVIRREDESELFALVVCYFPWH